MSGAGKIETDDDGRGDFVSRMYQSQQQLSSEQSLLIQKAMAEASRQRSITVPSHQSKSLSIASGARRDLSNCPPGLQYLMMMDQLVILQDTERLRIILRCQRRTKYKVYNKMGLRMYTATEETECCSRNWFGTCRSFEIQIKDHMGQEVIHLSQPIKYDYCCCPCFSCCIQELTVSSPALPSPVMGYVKEEWHPCLPKYVIANANQDPVLRIWGPFLSSQCCPTMDFYIYELDDSTIVGRIRKRWPTGVIAEMFPHETKFGVIFPVHLDVQIKAVLLGAAFLIDFVYFEESQF